MSFVPDRQEILARAALLPEEPAAFIRRIETLMENFPKLRHAWWLRAMIKAVRNNGRVDDAQRVTLANLEEHLLAAGVAEQPLMT